MPMPTAAASQPSRPKRRRIASSAKGDRLARTMPSLRLHGPSTPPSRSAAAICAAVHMPCPLIACLTASMPLNNGLAPVAASTSASSVHTPTMIASPPKVRRRPASSATAAATIHRNGR